VVKGDTLWDISGTFLQNPWCWPQVWGMNRDEIRNPHWIYPGQVIYFDRTRGRLSLTRPGSADGRGEPPLTRLSPQLRSESLERDAVQSIPAGMIEPYLTQPLVVEANALAGAPRIVASQEGRVYLVTGDRAYVRGSADLVPRPDSAATRSWRIFREALPLTDPDTGEILGYEAQYMGKAELVEGETLVTLQDAKGELRENRVPATIDITDAKSEIYAGDRLLPAPERSYSNYVPHAPRGEVNARVVSLYGDSAIRYAAQNQVIAINRGTRDAMAAGQVLQLVTQGDVIQDKTTEQREQVQLPRERNGLAMVFRTFDRVSYALILEVRRPVVVGDHLVAPR